MEGISDSQSRVQTEGNLDYEKTKEDKVDLTNYLLRRVTEIGHHPVEY